MKTSNVAIAATKPVRWFPRGWLSVGLVAGSLAIAVNTLLLKAADWIRLDIGHGGLLKLLHIGLQRYAGISLPPAGPAYKIEFHIIVGLGMALVYTSLLEPTLPPRLIAWMKGFVYAVFVWLLNAFLILPALGQGVAGSRVLGLAGILYYAFAHTVFFVLLALIVAKLKDKR